eukprot:9212566-Lingulodinium_polyedra.AAC.1
MRSLARQLQWINRVPCGRVGGEVDHPRPPAGTAGDGADARITSKHVQFLRYRACSVLAVQIARRRAVT